MFVTKKDMFDDMKEISNTRVLLPNQSRIPVRFTWSIKLSDSLLLKDVLFVPQFELNVISVTSITSENTITIKFYHDFYQIKHIINKKMIGK